MDFLTVLQAASYATQRCKDRKAAKHALALCAFAAFAPLRQEGRNFTGRGIFHFGQDPHNLFLRRRVAAAFTLVEVLVVIAIIGVMVAMLLPAVQSARESARRASCTNHLSQLILAVHNYEMAHGMYPPGTIDASGPIVNAPKGYHHSWTVQILPYLEEQNVYNAIDKSVGVYHKNNAAAARAMPRLFHCPSGNWRGITSSYAGVHHDQEKPIDAGDNGVFFLNSKLRYDDISDGSAHTLFLGEKLPDGWDLHWLSGTRATLRNTGSLLNALTVKTGLPLPLDVDLLAPDPDKSPIDEAAPKAVPATEAPPTPADPAATPEGAAPPDAIGMPPPKPPVPTTGPGSPLFVGGFGSYHPSGVNFAFGDGRVQLLSNSMSVTVLSQLANRKDGQLTPNY